MPPPAALDGVSRTAATMEISSSAHATSPPPVTGKRKRVVPDALRRRTAVSCDRCKTRRAKCIRNSASETCVNCANANVACESTLPRKHRVYGSLESLSLRYRALDALARGLLPGENTNDVEALLRIGREHGIPMPSPDDTDTVPEIFESAQTSPGAPPTPRVRPRAPSLTITSPLERKGSFSDRKSSFSDNQPMKPREEKLIPAPHGVGHYVGPSSSLGFAAAVRKMMARTCTNPKFMLSSRSQRTLRQDFLNLKVSKVIEIRDEAAGDVKKRIDEGPKDRQDSATNVSTYMSRSEDDGSTNKFLPPKTLADELVHAFFEDVHPSYPLFHRTIFQIRYETLWDPTKGPNHDFDPGWICALCLMFVFGALHVQGLDKNRSIQIQRKYLNIARSFVDQLVTTTSLQNVQAIMLIQLYYHNIGERNASWMFLGCASRMAIALGMHREGANTSFDTLEQNIRKTVWWTMYRFERNLCIILGRPSAIEESEITISFPDEVIESSIGLPALTAATSQVTQLAFRIKEAVYSPSDSRASDEESLVAVAKQLLTELEAWWERLPRHLKVGWKSAHSQQDRAIRLLDIYYHHTRSLATRSFLLNRINAEIESIENGQPFRRMSDDALELSDVCASAAELVIAQGAKLHQQGLLDGISWLDLYYIYHASFVLCLRPISQAADEPDTPDDLARKEMVKDILVKVRAMPMANTYATLVHVASQFASLVGALGDVKVGPASADGSETPSPTTETAPSHSFPIPTSSGLSTGISTAISTTASAATTHPTVNIDPTPHTYSHPTHLQTTANPSPHTHHPHIHLPPDLIAHPLKDWPPPLQTSWDYLARSPYPIEPVQNLPQPLTPHQQLSSQSLDPNSQLVPQGAAEGNAQPGSGWYEVQCGTYDDMIFPSTVGGTFGFGPFRGEQLGTGYLAGEYGGF